MEANQKRLLLSKSISAVYRFHVGAWGDTFYWWGKCSIGLQCVAYRGRGKIYSLFLVGFRGASAQDSVSYC